MECVARYIIRRRLHTVPAQPAYRPFPIPGVRCQTLASQGALTSLGLAYELTATSSLHAVPALAEPGSGSCPGPGLAPGPRWPARLKSWARLSTCRYSSAWDIVVYITTRPQGSPLLPHRRIGIVDQPLFSSEIVCHSASSTSSEVIDQLLSRHSGLPGGCTVRAHIRTLARRVRLPEFPIAAAEGRGSISRSAESTPAQTTWAITSLQPHAVLYLGDTVRASPPATCDLARLARQVICTCRSRGSHDAHQITYACRRRTGPRILRAAAAAVLFSSLSFSVSTASMHACPPAWAAC